MIDILKEVRVLKEEGKLHTKLLFRVRILFGIAVVMSAIVLYNIVFKGENILIASLLAIVGFILGLYVFSRMNVVHWNEEDEVVQMGKMDTLGFVILALYIVFEIGFRTFLADFYPTSATMFILSVVAGTLLGRAIGTVMEVHSVYAKNHPKKAT